MQRPRPMLTLMEGTLALLDRANAALRRESGGTAAERRDISGERAAYFHLRRLGFIVVARRWRHALVDGEADFIAWEGERLCFLEVKTRESESTVAAEFSVNPDKQAALRRVASAYIRQLPWRDGRQAPVNPRFDIVAVYLQPGERPDIRLMRDAFR